MKKILPLIVILLMLLALPLLASCHKGNEEAPPAEPQRPVIEAEPEPEPEPILNPLTNLPVADEAALARRVLVVSIDNFKAARPQAGISTADIMYEVPAEGGISRLLAVFYADTPELIGPVRSARPYMVDIAREWQGVFIHCGGSNDALSYLAKGEVNWLNEMSSSKYFWRDKKRTMPHNLFTASANIYEFLADKGWSEIQFPRAFSFYAEDDGPPSDSVLADIVHVNYSYAKNLYVYDADTRLYARSIGDAPHMDVNGEAQVQAANILIQRVKSKVLDSEGRLSINLVGEGEAMLFTRGTVAEGTWKRASLDEPTCFLGADGKEWQLSAGQTWIQLCDNLVKISYEDTTAVEEGE